MSRSISKTILLGNVGRDPEIQTTSSGAKVAHVSLATSRRIPLEGGGYDERTDWHRLTLWDRLAQLAEDYVRKGDRLFVEGRIEYGSFEKNARTIPTVEIVVHDLVLLGRPGGSAPAQDSGSDRPRGPREQRRRSGGGRS